MASPAQVIVDGAAEEQHTNKLKRSTSDTQAPDAKRQRLASWLATTPCAVKNALSRARGRLTGQPLPPSGAVHAGLRGGAASTGAQPPRAEGDMGDAAGSLGGALTTRTASAEASSTSLGVASRSLARLGSSLGGWVKDVVTVMRPDPGAATGSAIVEAAVEAGTSDERQSTAVLDKGSLRRDAGAAPAVDAAGKDFAEDARREAAEAIATAAEECAAGEVEARGMASPGEVGSGCKEPKGACREAEAAPAKSVPEATGAAAEERASHETVADAVSSPTDVYADYQESEHAHCPARVAIAESVREGEATAAEERPACRATAGEAVSVVDVDSDSQEPEDRCGKADAVLAESLPEAMGTAAEECVVHAESAPEAVGTAAEKRAVGEAAAGEGVFLASIDSYCVDWEELRREAEAMLMESMQLDAEWEA